MQNLRKTSQNNCELEIRDTEIQQVPTSVGTKNKTSVPPARMLWNILIGDSETSI